MTNHVFFSQQKSATSVRSLLGLADEIPILGVAVLGREPRRRRRNNPRQGEGHLRQDREQLELRSTL